MDWLNPETWKPFAALADYWKSIVGAAVVIGGALLAFLRWGRSSLSWAMSKIGGGWRTTRERPLRFVLREHQSAWSPCANGDQQGTLVHGHWDVTNISNRNVVILRARLKNRDAKYTHVLTLDPDERRTFGSRNPIPAHRISEVSADFIFFPVIAHGRDPVISDVIFTITEMNIQSDQFAFSIGGLNGADRRHLHSVRPLP